VDFGFAPNLVDGAFPFFLPVKDLSSRALPEVFPTRNMEAETVIEKLQFMFDFYGVPLVIKSDNGPCFIDGRVRAFLEEQGVFLLLSSCSDPS